MLEDVLLLQLDPFAVPLLSQLEALLSSNLNEVLVDTLLGVLDLRCLEILMLNTVTYKY
jgi:hypothetical protein